MNLEEFLLKKFMEELAELSIEVSKCSDFGFDNVKPGGVKTNLERMNREFIDLIATGDLIQEHCGVQFSFPEEALENKKNKIKFFAGILIQRGRLQGEAAQKFADSCNMDGRWPYALEKREGDVYVDQEGKAASQSDS